MFILFYSSQKKKKNMASEDLERDAWVIGTSHTHMMVFVILRLKSPIPYILKSKIRFGMTRTSVNNVSIPFWVNYLFKKVWN